jgi:Mu transposase, C-terminal domain
MHGLWIVWPRSTCCLCQKHYGWERFATEERKVTWDGYVSYDGVLYGLPGTLQRASKQVQVRERKGVLTIWSAGHQVFEIAKRPRSRGLRAPCATVEDGGFDSEHTPGSDALRPRAASPGGRKPSLTGVRSILWDWTRRGAARMKKSVCKHLKLVHLEAALPQLLERARTEQWTYETELLRALAAELDGREQKAWPGASKRHASRAKRRWMASSSRFNPRGPCAACAS